MTYSSRLRAWARRVKRDGLTLFFAGTHLRTPWYAKALGVLVVAYALSPIDLIPDFIPVLGFVDDVLLLPGLVWLSIKLLPDGVLAESRQLADKWQDSNDAKARSKLGSALVVLIWLLARGAVWHWWSDWAQG
jgi:uncharacterized membrane protein YkvA (DUF1232 family)